MPVLVFVGEILEEIQIEVSCDPQMISHSCTHLGIDSYDLVALLAVVGKHILVALDAVRVIVTQHVPLPGQ